MAFCLIEMQTTCTWTRWGHCHTIISCFFKIQNSLPFWCLLTQFFLEMRLLDRCFFYLFVLITWIQKLWNI